MAKTIQIQVPESFQEVLGMHAPGEALLARWSFEALVIEAYREGLISRGKIGELLDMHFDEREAWLKDHDVPYLIDETDLAKDRITFSELFGR